MHLSSVCCIIKMAGNLLILSTEYVSWKKKKLFDIHQALNSDPVDIETLRKAAVTEGGLLTDEIRRKVWPKLLNVNVFNLPAKPGKLSVELHLTCSHCLLPLFFMFTTARSLYQKSFSMTAGGLIHLIDQYSTLNLTLCHFFALIDSGKDVRENHKDYNQVLLDVRRSMRRFPRGKPAIDFWCSHQPRDMNVVLSTLTP